MHMLDVAVGMIRGVGTLDCSWLLMLLSALPQTPAAKLSPLTWQGPPRTAEHRSSAPDRSAAHDLSRLSCFLASSHSANFISRWPLGEQRRTAARRALAVCGPAQRWRQRHRCSERRRLCASPRYRSRTPQRRCS